MTLQFSHSTFLSPIPAPRFEFDEGQPLLINGTECLFERRIGDRHQFLDMVSKEPHFFTDSELATLAAEGRFHPGFEDPRKHAGPVLHPFAVSDEQRAQNMRKHEYVAACLQAPGGFARSRKRLEPVIAAVAQQHGEKAPHFTTVLAWINESQTLGDQFGTAAHTDRFDLRGSRVPKLAAIHEHAIERGIKRWLLHPKMPMLLAYAKVVSTMRAYERKLGKSVVSQLDQTILDDEGRLRIPSLSTFQRRCNSIDRYTRDLHKIGPRHAALANRTYTTREKPDIPYDHVEVDHCTLDLLVVHEQGAILGRPDLVTFRDRATGMIIGIGLGFEVPSYASFLEGLRHATFPKDLSPYPSVTNPWPCYGRIRNLYVDNALHFIGDSIRAAGKELKFNLVKFRPREPWLKGALERFFGTINTGLVHMLPGTTLQNILERRKIEELDEPCLTLREFKVLLHFWICEIYHAQNNKGLGPIPGIGLSPLAAWADKAKDLRTPPLPSPDLFTALAGEVKYKTIQNDGIAWDHIKYEGAALSKILTNPKHRNRGRDGGATAYKVVRNPFDLSKIFIVNHHTNEIEEVPSAEAYRKYTSDLSAFQHDVMRAHARAQRDGAINVEKLMAVKDRLSDIIVALLRGKQRRVMHRRLARYLDAEERRRIPSQIALPNSEAVAAADHVDVVAEAAAPVELRETSSKAASAAAAPASAPSLLGFAPLETDDEDDVLFDRLKSEKNWK